jgi:hypothetical protein
MAGRDISGLRDRGRGVISTSSSEEDDDEDDEDDEDEEEEDEGDAGSSSSLSPSLDVRSSELSDSSDELSAEHEEEDSSASVSRHSPFIGIDSTNLLRLKLTVETLLSLSDSARFLNATVMAIGTSADGRELKVRREKQQVRDRHAMNYFSLNELRAGLCAPSVLPTSNWLVRARIAPARKQDPHQRSDSG